MTQDERHFLSNQVEALLKANSAEEFERMSSRSMEREASEELNNSLLKLSELSSSLKMDEPIIVKIRHSFNHLQGEHPHIHHALEMAEVDL